MENILRKAGVEAERLGRDEIEPRDILLALVSEVKGLSAMVFAKLGADIGAIQATLEQVSAQGVRASNAKSDLSEASQRVLRLARTESYVLFHGCVEAEHLLLGLVSADGDELQGVLKENGIGINGAKEAVVKVLKEWGTDPSSPDL